VKKTFLICAALLAYSAVSGATTLVTGTDNSDFAATALSMHFGTLVNFDNLAPNSAVASNAYTSVGVQSIASTNASDPLMAEVGSSQSYPIYLTNADNAGNILITLTNPVQVVGIGIQESDGLAPTLEALGSTGNVLGSFAVSLPQNGEAAFTGYFALLDPTSDIKSLEIMGASGGAYAIDDLQFAPEPANLMLVGGGLLAMAFFAIRRRRPA